MRTDENDDPSASPSGNPREGPASDGGTSDCSDVSRPLIDLNRVPLIAGVDAAGCASAPGDAEVMMEGDGPRYFDEVLGNSDGIGVPSRALGNRASGFQVGDMVWAKVKSHPWWPGQIFNEAFASPSVRRTKREGHLLVAFFGDSSYGWFEPAELVPFGPNFSEKSKQTNLRYFLCAVQEAISEISRRESLALTCYCRNESNFQPARVQGYVYVDVAGFEPGAIYSSKQINTARDEFVPEKALSFLQQLAIDPFSGDGLVRTKNTSMLLAYRRAVYEEFDDTYAQAFGAEPLRLSRPSRPTGFVLGHTERFAYRATSFLKGEQVVPQLPQKRSKSSTKPSLKSAKTRRSPMKNNYVLKRRADPKQGQESIVSDPSHQPTIVFLDSPSSSQSSSKLDDFVLQKRPPADVNPPPQTFLSKIELEIPAPDVEEIKPKLLDGAQLKKAKIKKRRREDSSSGAAGSDCTGHVEMKKKKKKKKKNDEEQGGVICLPDGPKASSENKDAASSAAEPSALPDLMDSSSSRSELLELVEDLHELARRPLYGVDQGAAPSAALKLRSLVYKNMDVSPASDAEEQASASPMEVDQAGATLGPPTPEEPVRESIEISPPAAAPAASAPVAAAGGNRQRSTSDRQEETTAKRQKKPKAVSGEKKATSSSKPGAATPAETASPPPPPPSPSPTALVMRFPPRTTLPSVASLKARFARFGPLELSGIRVLWKSNTCRVVYKFRPDAESALNFATNNGIFGRINVHYHLRDAADGAVTESRPSDGLQLRAGNGMASTNLSFPNQAKHQNFMPMPLRSILKKPGGNAGTRSTGRGTRRVRFMLRSSGSPPRPPHIPPPPVEATASKSLSSAAFLPLQPPPTFSHPPPPQTSRPPPPPRNVGGFPAQWRRGETEGEFADQMISLLVRCRDIVSNVKSSTGHLPYQLL